MRKWFALVVVLVLLAAACGGDDGDVEASSSANSSDDDDTVGGGGFDFEFEPEGEEELSNEEVIEYVQEFWDDEADEVDLDYEPIPDERITAVPPEDGGDGPTCDGFTVTPLDVQQNAFVADCGEGLLVAWDPVLIDETLTELFGETGPAVVFAHEWGHAIQFQQGVFTQVPSVLAETQADCYAGAWVAHAAEDGFGPFTDVSSLDQAIGAMLFVRDQPGSTSDAPGAHGSGFDRVRAFADGVDRGAEYCYGYLENSPPIFQIPFSGEELATQGNLPFDEVVDLVQVDLNDYFPSVVEDFDEVDDPFEAIPEDELEALHGEIGDGAVATVFGMLWAERAQAAAGDEVDGEGPLLQRACLVGSWLGDILDDQEDGVADRESGAQLSGGDLDEAIYTFLNLAEQSMSEPGTAFEAVADMRLGVIDGIDACLLGE